MNILNENRKNYIFEKTADVKPVKELTLENILVKVDELSSDLQTFKNIIPNKDVQNWFEYGKIIDRLEKDIDRNYDNIKGNLVEIKKISEDITQIRNNNTKITLYATSISTIIFFIIGVLIGWFRILEFLVPGG